VLDFGRYTLIIEADNNERKNFSKENKMLTQEQIDFILSLPYDEVSYAELGEMLEGEFPNPQEFDEACEIFEKEYEIFETLN
jgi:hypothetical protein